MMTMPVVMTAFKSLADKYRCKIGENKGLYKRNQYFQQVNEHGKQHEQRRSAPAQPCAHSAKNKNQDDKAQDDDVARYHIGKQTYDQGEGLGKNAHDFDRHHNYLDRA